MKQLQTKEQASRQYRKGMNDKAEGGFQEFVHQDSKRKKKYIITLIMLYSSNV